MAFINPVEFNYKHQRREIIKTLKQLKQQFREIIKMTTKNDHEDLLNWTILQVLCIDQMTSTDIMIMIIKHWLQLLVRSHNQLSSTVVSGFKHFL